MITNMQIVNHVREDGWQIHAIFNMDRWGDLPCQLVSHPCVSGYRVKGMWRPDDRGICGFTDLNERFADEALGMYEQLMSEYFGPNWRDIKDGRTRVMEWVSREPALKAEA